MPRHQVRAWSLLCAAGLLAASVGCFGRKPPVQPQPPPPPTPTPRPVVNTPPPPPPPPPTSTPTTRPAPPPPAPTELELFNRMTLDQLNASKPLDDVYFDYDQAELSDAARAALQKDADWMRKWTSTRITIEGHADSRGTNEYNLALGERRAAAARDYLVSLGIAASRVSVVSKGEEQPFCTEDVESCWLQNRRGHFIVTGK